MRKVKWGIIGTGRIAGDFVSDFKYVDNAEVAAVASRTQQSAEGFARKYEIPKAFGTYRMLLEDPEVEAVYVATPHSLHFDNSYDALASGKAVLCEKPITTNPQDFQQLRDYATEQRRYLMEGMWTYFHPAIQRTQHWVNSGRIGKLIQVKADFGFPVPFDPNGRMYNPQLAGGALLDMGIYPIAMAWLFVRQDVQDLHVTCHKSATGVDDEVNILMSFGDVKANLATSFRSKLSNNLLLIGTKATIQVPFYWKAQECFLYEKDQLVDHYHDGRASIGFNHELQAVSSDILQGKLESAVMPHRHSAKFQEMMAAVMERF